MSSLSITDSFNTIRSITHPLVAKKIADNITNKIPLLYLLNKMGNKEYEYGGFDYRVPVFKELQSVQAYTGSTVLSTNEADPVTSAQYVRKQLTVPIFATGTKMLQNTGNSPETIINYLTVLIETAEESMKNGMDVQLFSANTESDLGITGLQNLVSTTPTTGVSGGLDRSVYTFWRNQTASITAFGTDGLTGFRSLYFNCLRGDEFPTCGIITQSMYINLHRSLTSTIQYNQPSPKTTYGDLAFEHIYFQGMPVMFGTNVPANSGFFLNLKYMSFMVAAERDFTIREFITPDNQDAMVARIYWAGNLISSNMNRQGVFTGTGDTY